jgi:16S rRNA G1207 methylase RsmC
MKPMKLKCTLLTEDGEVWLVIRQHYASNLKTNELLDESFQGLKLKTIHEEENENEPSIKNPK